MLDLVPLLKDLSPSDARLPAVETPGPLDRDPPPKLQVLHDEILPLLKADVITAARRRWWLGTPSGLVTAELTLTLWFDTLPPPAERLSLELTRQMRPVPRERVRPLKDGPGEVAVGWGWERDEALDVVGMIRGNAVVTARGSDGRSDGLLRMIDVALQAALREKEAKLPARLEPLRAPVAPLARVDLGAWPESVIGRATRGHVNRDAEDPGLAYYRAPREAGAVTVSLVEPLPGLLARHERLATTVAGKEPR